jgi:non-heme chloroperoxidase
VKALLIFLLLLATFTQISQEPLKPTTTPGAQNEFIKLILNKGIARARQVYEAEKAKDSPKSLFTEAELNSLGYQFLYQQRRVNDAIEVFRLNVEAHPTSANVYDSLAEGYFVNGQKNLAVKNYLMSLELDPKNRNAIDMLARIWVQLPNDGWKDKSPHKSDFIDVNGITLHYLDWGGPNMEALVFLAGMGNSAHIFDDMAPEFTDRFRVLGLTRRGHGQSDRPETGYDTMTLVEDIKQFLDAMKLGRVNLIGHSLAGDELTRFANLYPERVLRLVYLDAANDRSDLTDVDIYKMIPSVFELLSPSVKDVSSYAAYRNWTHHKVFGFWSDAQEADRRVTIFGPDGQLRPALTANVANLLNQGTRESRPDYTKLKAPALSLHSIFSLETAFPWLTPVDMEEHSKAQEFLNRVLIPRQHKQAERFRREVRGSKVIEMPATHHYLFITRRREVTAEIRRFLIE